MACEFSVLLGHDCAEPIGAGSAALDEIDRQEARLSVYRDTSLVSRINRFARAEAVSIGPELCDLLLRAGLLSEATESAFDVTTGALIKAWGFFRGPRRVPSPGRLRNALARTGMGHMRIDTDACTVRFDRWGVEINLGSIGKGHALDRAGSVLQHDFAVSSFLIQGGQSSILAVGVPASDGRGWPVAIADPTHVGRTAAIVRLKDAALGTSGAAHQFVVQDGKRYGHVLDPRTGWPASGLAGVSVRAGDAATADALATALFVLGFERAIQFCRNHPEIAVLLIPQPDDPEHPQPVAVNFDEHQIVWAHSRGKTVQHNTRESLCLE